MLMLIALFCGIIIMVHFPQYLLPPSLLSTLMELNYQKLQVIILLPEIIVILVMIVMKLMMMMMLIRLEEPVGKLMHWL